MAQGRFRAGIRQDAGRDRLEMMAEQRRLQEDINEKSGGAQLGRMFGSLGVGGIAALMGAGPVGLALWAALGSRAGGEIGELNTGIAGKEMEDLVMEGDYGYGASDYANIENQMLQQTEGYDTKQWIQSGQDAFTAWSLGTSPGYKAAQVGLSDKYLGPIDFGQTIGGSDRKVKFGS